MTALQGAVESSAPGSRLHLHQSFEVADFPVPTSREEEWQFTPLRRLRGLPPWGPDKITEDGRGQLRALGFNVLSPHAVLMIPQRNPRISREMLRDHGDSSEPLVPPLRGATVGVRLAPVGSAPGIAWAVQLVPAGNQNWLICARCDVSPGSQPAANIRRSGCGNIFRLSRRGDVVVVSDSADEHEVLRVHYGK